MSSALWRWWFVPLLIVLSVGTTSCGTYESLGSTPSIIDEQVDPGDRVRVWFSAGGWREEFVVRIEEDVLVCRRDEFRWEDIEALELWRNDALRTLGLVGGVVAVAVLILMQIETPMMFQAAG